jgi:hypothetical protein
MAVTVAARSGVERRRKIDDKGSPIRSRGSLPIEIHCDQAGGATTRGRSKVVPSRQQKAGRFVRRRAVNVRLQPQPVSGATVPATTMNPNTANKVIITMIMLLRRVAARSAANSDSNSIRVILLISLAMIFPPGPPTWLDFIL